MGSPGTVAQGLSGGRSLFRTCHLTLLKSRIAYILMFINLNI